MMSGDVRVVGTPLVTNVDVHLKAVGPVDGANAKQERDAGLQLLYHRTEVDADSKTSDLQASFVPLARVPSLKSNSRSTSTAPVSIHPPTNIPVPSRTQLPDNPPTTTTENGTKVPPPRVLPPSFLGTSSSTVRPTPPKQASFSKNGDFSSSNTPSKTLMRNASPPSNAFDSIQSFDSSPPSGSKNSSKQTPIPMSTDDIVGFTQEDPSQLSRRTVFPSSQITSSYDSGYDDIADIQTPDPISRAFVNKASASSDIEAPSTRLTATTSVSAGYNPYALLQQQRSGSSVTPSTIAIPPPEGESLPTMPAKTASPAFDSTAAAAERQRLQSNVSRANLDYRKIKMFIENCTQVEDLDELEPKLQAAAAALRAANEALERFNPSAMEVSVSPPLSTVSSLNSSISAPRSATPTALASTSPLTSSPPFSAGVQARSGNSGRVSSTAMEVTTIGEEEDAHSPVVPSIPADSFAPRSNNGLNSLWPTNNTAPYVPQPRTTADSDWSVPSTSRSFPSETYSNSGPSTGFSYTSTSSISTTTTNTNGNRPATSFGSSSTTNTSKSTSITSASSHIMDVVDVDDGDAEEEEFDFEALDRIESAASARTIVRPSLPSTSSGCTSNFDPIPPCRGVSIEQYDPSTALQSKWHAQNFEWTPTLNSVIQRTFGHQQWRTNQLEIVNAIMAKKDVFVTMPTGGGKSLCYQVPALACPGVTVVIQPLISLIEDQMMILTGLDIPCAFLAGKDYDGPWGTTDFDSVYQGITSNPPLVKILFITPERLTTGTFILNRFADLSRGGLLTMFVVDECHCVSQWGHEFRPSYKELSKLKEHCSSVPILALTATATVLVKVDILTVLRFFDQPRNVVCFTSSFNRPNLFFEVRPKTKTMRTEILEFIRARPGQSGIVYCLSRADCENFALEMQQQGLECDYYHAQLPTRQRANVQSRWYNNELQFICATIAFGMGINKPDVRWVIHASIPKSLEGFYQEAGRAGRDGDAADCVVFSSGKDMTILKRMALSSGTHEPYRANDPVHANLMRLTQLATFLEDRSVCRRILLMEYFGEKDSSKAAGYNCGNCDTCLNANSPLSIEASPLVKSILSEYRAILLEPGVESTPRTPGQKGKRAAAPKASHYLSQVSSGTLRERCLSKGFLSFLDSPAYQIRFKTEQRAFFDYIFGKLVMKGVFIDVSSIGMLGKKGGYKMKFPPCHFMYELSHNANVVSFERQGCKLPVIWKRPPKGARLLSLDDDDMDGDDIVNEEVSPAKKAKRGSKAASSTSATPSRAKKSATPAKASASSKVSSAKSSASAASTVLPRLSLDEYDEDYDDNDDDQEYNFDDNQLGHMYADHDEYAMSLDLDNPESLIRSRSSLAAPTSTTSFGGSTSTSSLPGASLSSSSAIAPKSTAISAKSSSSAQFGTSTSLSSSGFNLTAKKTSSSSTSSTPPSYGSYEKGKTAISSPNREKCINIDDAWKDELEEEVQALLEDRAPMTSKFSASSSSNSTLRSASPVKSLIGRPPFVTPAANSASSASTVLKSKSSYTTNSGPGAIDVDDEDDDVLDFQRFVAPLRQKTTGPADPQKSLRDKLLNELRQLRTQIGREENYNQSGATQVTSLFPDAVLHQIAYELPKTVKDFAMVNGIGDRRSEKYGGRFIFVIGEFLAQHKELLPLPSSSESLLAEVSGKSSTSSVSVVAKRTTQAKIGFSKK